jgi:hypothetical protein
VLHSVRHVIVPLQRPEHTSQRLERMLAASLVRPAQRRRAIRVRFPAGATWLARKVGSVLSSVWLNRWHETPVYGYEGSLERVRGYVESNVMQWEEFGVVELEVLERNEVVARAFRANM